MVFDIIKMAKLKKKKKGYHSNAHYIDPYTTTTTTIITTTTTTDTKRCKMKFFNNLLTVLSSTRTIQWFTWPGRNSAKITCNTSGSYHVQHAACHTVQTDSSAIMYDTAETPVTSACTTQLKPQSLQCVRHSWNPCHFSVYDTVEIPVTSACMTQLKSLSFQRVRHSWNPSHFSVYDTAEIPVTSALLHWLKRLTYELTVHSVALIEAAFLHDGGVVAADLGLLLGRALHHGACTQSASTFRGPSPPPPITTVTHSQSAPFEVLHHHLPSPLSHTVSQHLLRSFTTTSHHHCHTQSVSTFRGPSPPPPITTVTHSQSAPLEVLHHHLPSPLSHTVSQHL